MQTYSDKFAYELRKLISERVEDLKDILAEGLAIEGIGDYQRIVGQISGMKEALDLFDEAERIIEQG